MQIVKFSIARPVTVGMFTIALVLFGAISFNQLSIDLLPDFIPVLGQLDEVALVLLLVRLFISLAPADVVAEYRGEAPASKGEGAAGASANADRKGATPKNAREDVIDADFRVVSDG